MLGKLKKRWLSYLNKENFDYTQGPVDPFEYHSCFLVFAKLFNVMDYEKVSIWMYVSPVTVVFSAVLAAVMIFISALHYAMNLQLYLVTECGTYFLLMCYKLLIVSCTFTDKKYYHRFLRAMRDDFQYICTKGIKYRERFFENQRLTFKACVLTAIFTGSIGSGMSICACISLTIFVSGYVKDQDSDRPMMFPFWLFDYDVQATPTFEILFALSLFFTFNHTYVYIFSMQTQILWVREIMCKADIVIWRIQELLDGVAPAKNNEERDYYTLLIRHRMREIIKIHNSMFELMKDFASVYKKCLLFEQKVAGPIICMTAFCAAEKLDDGEVHFMLFILLTSSIVLVFIPSYLCTFLLEKVQSVSDACWDIPFWNAGPIVRPYLVLMMQRSVRPLPIVAAGFEDISLQTYSNIITRSYSCFNMLRQASS